ncbi:MAG: dethiobiotin synthase [Nocardioidaceae bacterium]
MTRFVVVTGTGSGVGKTVATAALATSYAAHSLEVAVVKPVQTGLLGGEPGDLYEITQLSGVDDVHEFVRLPDPLAPDTAARLRDIDLPTVAEFAEKIAAIPGDVVLVEGSGGVLVRLDREGGTIVDMVLALQELGAEVEVIVVVTAGLGTLNHAELTVEALRNRGVEPVGLVIGCWPREPDLAARCNRDDLPQLTGVPLWAVIPELNR